MRKRTTENNEYGIAFKHLREVAGIAQQSFAARVCLNSTQLSRTETGIAYRLDADTFKLWKRELMAMVAERNRAFREALREEATRQQPSDLQKASA